MVSFTLISLSGDADLEEMGGGLETVWSEGLGFLPGRIPGGGRDARLISDLECLDVLSRTEGGCFLTEEEECRRLTLPWGFFPISRGLLLLGYSLSLDILL
jgi:hypothetical protein